MPVPEAQPSCASTKVMPPMMSSPNAFCDATMLQVTPPSLVAATVGDPSMTLSASSHPWSASAKSTASGICSSALDKGSVTRDHVDPPSTVRTATEVNDFL